LEGYSESFESMSLIEKKEKLYRTLQLGITAERKVYEEELLSGEVDKHMEAAII
jgi:hypothetical protein